MSEMITFQSSRFGEMSVPANTVIEFPVGLVGFPENKRFVVLDYKDPFSWLHSLDDPSLAFVVIDGSQFGDSYSVTPPMGEATCEFKKDDEVGVLVIITVRPDPSMTTANLKAPIFVNMRNRKATQIIFDDPRYSTRHSLWQPDEK